MRLKLSILPILLVLTWAPAFAESVDPDLPRLIREAQKPRVQYGPARVGWDEPARQAATSANATFESLRWDSPQAIRTELKSVLLPPWQVVVTFAALIFALRRLRPVREDMRPASEVLPFPLPRPHQEAA